MPGSERARVIGRHGDGWKVRVDAPPEQGKANARLQKFVASLVGVRGDDVQIVSGASGRDKLVAVHGVDAVLLARLLDAASGK